MKVREAISQTNEEFGEWLSLYNKRHKAGLDTILCEEWIDKLSNILIELMKLDPNQEYKEPR